MEWVDPDLVAIIEQFAVPGQTKSCEIFGSGHIHDTYLLNQGNPSARFILQKFNHQVFTEPLKVTHNLELILAHLKEKRSHCPLEPLTIVPTIQQESIYFHQQRGYWRMFEYVEDSYVVDQVQNNQQALEGSRAFGVFLALLGDFPVHQLHVTIPNFHHVGHRFQQLKEAINLNPVNRLAEVNVLVEMALERQPQVEQLSQMIDGKTLPLKVTHNDTKISNILFHRKTLQGLSVVDLDTVMPGFLMYDFGDMARTFCNLGKEEAPQCDFSMGYFLEICKGFLVPFKGQVTHEEIESLNWGPWLMTYIMGIRFLADYIRGDTYYKVSYPRHNFDRASNQLHLVKKIEDAAAQIQATILQYVT